MGFKNSLEWQIGSVKSESIAFLTHASFLTGQRERYLTVYPFAHIILNGRLADNPFFSSFQKGKVFIFCNFRPKPKRGRPDLLAFSSMGDVFLVEGKQRRRGNEALALKNLVTGVMELGKYLRLLREFSEKSKKAPYECWSLVYKNCYVKDLKHGFPELNKFVSNAISLEGYDNIRALFRKINDNVNQGNILFGLAFNDPDDQEPFFPLDSFHLMPKPKYKPNPKGGVEKNGYSVIDNEKIYSTIGQRWDKKRGQFFLFGIDKSADSFRILDPSA